MATYHIQHRQVHTDRLWHTFTDVQNIVWSKNLNDPHTITYQISLDDPGILEEHTPEGDFAGAYQTDFRLVRDGNIRMAGIITSVHIPQGEEYVELTGYDYSHYLSRRIYPFDPLHPLAYRLVMKDKDVTEILWNMLHTTLSMDFSLEMDLTDLRRAWAGNSGTTFDDRMRIEFGDTEDILSKIKTLGEGQPPECFDFEVTWDKKFKLYHPEYSDPTNSVWAFGGVVKTDRSSPSFTDLNWTDNGPRGTHILGVGAGLASKLGAARGTPHGQLQFRRLDYAEDFGDVANRTKLNRLTEGALAAAARPQREVPVKIVPEDVRTPEGDGFFDIFHPGVYFVVSWNLGGGHIVHGEHKCLGFEVTVDNEGNEEVELHEVLWKAWFDIDDIQVQV